MDSSVYQWSVDHSQLIQRWDSISRHSTVLHHSNHCHHGGHLAIHQEVFNIKLRFKKHTCVNDKKIDTSISSSLLHTPWKCDEITPISTIVLLLQVTFQPAMSISLFNISWVFKTVIFVSLKDLQLRESWFDPILEVLWVLLVNRRPLAACGGHFAHERPRKLAHSRNRRRRWSLMRPLRWCRLTRTSSWGSGQWMPGTL